MGIALDKLLIEVYKTHKHQYLSYRSGFRPIINGYNLVLFHFNAIQGYHKPEVSHTYGMPFTFRNLDV